MTARDRYEIPVIAKFEVNGREVKIPQLNIRMSENDGYAFMSGDVDQTLDGISILPTASLEGLEQILKEKKIQKALSNVNGQDYINKLKEMIEKKEIRYS